MPVDRDGSTGGPAGISATDAVDSEVLLVSQQLLLGNRRTTSSDGARGVQRSGENNTAGSQDGESEGGQHSSELGGFDNEARQTSLIL
jgi:hypothetical protein